MTETAILQSSIPSAFRFTNPSKPDFLLSKISWVFGLFLAAGASYCIYNISRCYQFIYNPSSQLDDQLKLVKCKMLLDEIQEKLKSDSSTNVKPLLQECEALQSSMIKRKHQEILPKLVNHYSKIDSSHAYQLAQSLSSAYDLFNAAQSIQMADPNFDSTQLSSLFQKAFQAVLTDDKNQKIKTPAFPALMEVDNSLEYANAFHSLQEDGFKQQALTRAKKFADECENAPTKFQAFCKIAKTLKKLEDPQQSKEMIEKAQQLCNPATSQEEFIYAHLALADVFLFLKDYKKMDEALDKVIPLQSQEGVHWLAVLLKKISATNDIDSKFKTVSAESVINEGFEDLQNSQSGLSAENRANAYLEFASVYQKLKMQDEAQKALDYAILAIESMPESTEKEIQSKSILLELISVYEQMSNETIEKILQLLEKCYNQSSMDWIGESILRFCNKNNLTEKSKEFFQKYLSTINQEDQASDKIIRLAILAKPGNDQSDAVFSIEQCKRMLEAAEGFVSKVPSYSYVQMIALIAEGYQKVDRQKSLEILNNYVKDQAAGHLKTAITTIAMGILFVYYPQQIPLASLGLVVYQLYQHLL